MKTKLSLITLFACALLPCENAFAAAVTVYDQDGEQVATGETLNAIKSEIDGTTGFKVVLSSDIVESYYFYLSPDSSSLAFDIVSDGEEIRTISGGGSTKIMALLGYTTTTTLTCENICFSDATNCTNGGAISALGSLYLGGNASFLNNIANEYGYAGATIGGGAIKAENIVFLKDAKYSFQNNKSSYEVSYGGAVRGTIMLNEGASVYFSGNNAHTYGGAVYGGLTLDSNAEVTFLGNYLQKSGDYVCGGAIYGDLTLGVGAVATFSGNYAQSSGDWAFGGAVYGSLTLDSNAEVTFLENYAQTSNASAGGGAIYGDLTLGVGAVATFSGNYVQSSSATVKGGAIAGNLSIGAGATAIFSGSYAQSDEGDAEGGAIYGDVIIESGATVEFLNNSAGAGGAVYGNVTIGSGATMKFLNNSAEAGAGGAIYCVSTSAVTFDADSQTTFSENYAKTRGGAIYYTYTDGVLTFDGGTHNFLKNDAIGRGGAIATTAKLVVNSGSKLTFDDNYALIFGGAVYSDGGKNINLNSGSDVVFSNNLAYSGGAIYSTGAVNLLGKIQFETNSAVYNEKHTAPVAGGAISTDTSVTFGKLQETSFTGNSVTATVEKDARGGAIYAATSVLFNGGSATFENNSVTAVGPSSGDWTSGGGAIYTSGTVTVKSDSTVKFIGNSVTATAGGAFGGGAISANSLSLAGNLEFTENSATRTTSSSSLSNGGAILSQGDLSFDAGTIAAFNRNSAAFGGAIRVIEGTLGFSGADGKLTFSENTAHQGGAIYVGHTSKIDFSGNLVFTGNKAASNGGAIYLGTSSKGSSTLSFSGDTTNVVFSGNKIGNDTDGWTSNDICAYGDLNSISIVDVGTYEFGGGIDASVGNSVSISEANVTFGGESVSKFAGAVTLADSAKLVLEKGANVGLLSGASMSVGAGVEFTIKTDLNSATLVSVANGASITFDETAKLVIDVSTVSSLMTLSATADDDELNKIAIFTADTDAAIGDINDVEVLVDGKSFSGSWEMVKEDNSLYLVAAIPEPSAFGLLAGIGALALCASRRKRRQ